jgi:hypothetical protein
MEHFDDHWAAVQTWLGQSQSQVVLFNRSRAQLVKHPSSDDPFGSSAAATTLIAADPAVQRALCFLLLPDFINLGCAASLVLHSCRLCLLSHAAHGPSLACRYTMPQACRQDQRMTAVLQWLDAPTQMVRASSQEAGPRPTETELAPLMDYMRKHQKYLHGGHTSRRATTRRSRSEARRRSLANSNRVAPRSE